MAEPPIYVSNLAIDRPGGALLQPQALPPSGGLEQIGSAVAGFATAAGGFVTAVKQAQDQTQAAMATGDYLTKLQELEIAHSKDPDFQSSPERFKAARRELELETSASISNPTVRQLTMLQWQRAGLSAQKHVTNAAFGREKDANQASILTHSEEALRSADAAGSEDERKAVFVGHINYVKQQANAGWISQEAAVRYVQQFQTSLSRADAMRDQRVDPLGQPARIADRKNYPGLDPVTRESFALSAANSHDQVFIDGLARQAMTSPAAAREAYEAGKDKLQPHSQFRALQAIDAAERQAEAALDKAARAQASADYNKDPVAKLLGDGYDIAAVRVENLRNSLTASAARGDETAQSRLRDLDLQLTMKPHTDRAWQTPYGILNSEIQRADAAMHAEGANPSPLQVAQLKAFKAVRDEIEKKRETEPILLTARASGEPLGPLDTRGPLNDAVLRGELWQRGPRAIVGALDHGGSANVLTAEEAGQFKQRYEAAGPNEKFNMLKTFAETLTGKAYKDTLAAVAGKDPMTEYVGTLALSRPSLAREIIEGNAVLGDAKTQEKSSLVRAALDRHLGGRIMPGDGQQETLVSAALAVDAARRASRGALYDPNDVSGIAKALDDVAGPITRRNGAKFPITPGIPPARFLGALDNLTDNAVASQGGAVDATGRALTASFLRDNAVLRPLAIGGNEYAVMLPDSSPGGDGFKAVLTARGPALIFDMRQVVAGDAPARLARRTPAQKSREEIRAASMARIQETRTAIEQPGELVTTPVVPAGEPVEE